MRKTLSVFFIIALFTALAGASSLVMPTRAHADDGTTTDPQNPPAPDPTPAPITIHANVNVRYQGSLVWTGSVALTKSSTAAVADSSGSTRTIASDSALLALETADAMSNGFNVSDLRYYADFDSYYVKCLDIAAASAHACDYWQYVVNSAYPPVGIDKYTVQDGDTIYFYFGNPRRVTIASPNGIVSSPVSVKAETYDYTNDTWIPLPGADVGATQPNPNDPYSPLVITTAKSGSDGIANLAITKPGSYGVGLAQDYYSTEGTLSVIAPQAGGATVSAVSTGSGSATTMPIAPVGPVRGTLVATSSEPMASFVPTATTTEAIPTGRVLGAETEKDPAIVLDVSLDEFLKRYAEALAKESAASGLIR